MKHFAIGFCATALLGLFTLESATTPAAAISANLAIKCRNMAIKAYPPKRTGTKGGTAGAERKYYQACLKNNGSAPDDDKQNPPPQPTSK